MITEDIVAGSINMTDIIMTEGVLLGCISIRITNNRQKSSIKAQRVRNQIKTIGMQRDRNRNIMVSNKDHKHITVTGFIGDNKGTPAKKVRAGKGKPQVKKTDKNNLLKE